MLGIYALTVLAVVAGPVAARVDIQGSIPVTSISADQIQSLPLKPLDISLLKPGGGAVSVRGVTGADGGLPVVVRPRGSGQTDMVIMDGTLAVPDNSFGVLRDAQVLPLPGVEAIEVLRQPFGVMYGQMVNPMNFVTRAVDPFMLLCRGDEGVPTRLNTGEHYSLDFDFSGMAGKNTDMSLGLRADYRTSGLGTEQAWNHLQSGGLGKLSGEFSAWKPNLFPLPDYSGYQLDMDAGAQPGNLQDVLQSLKLKGTIKAYEPDPCWQYYPDSPGVAGNKGCIPGERPFEQKAVRYGDDIKASLRDAYTGKPIGDAWVLYGPLAPTPFYDPGEQPGDELPPTFTRTDALGRYNIPLTGLAGAFEVQVARDCDSHATVAIADPAGTHSPGGSSGGTTPPPGGGGKTSGPPATSTSTSAGPVSSAPEEKPPEGEWVCGPDITDNVLGTLNFMVETFNQWDEATKDAKCASLYGLQADGAWEMRHMGPFDSDRGKDQYLYFGRYFPDRCAIPRWPCGATVQFLGVCMDVQIVNYVAWGAMNQLCDNQDVAMLAHMARDRVVNVFRGLKDAIVNKSPSSLRIGKGAAYDAQDAMSHIGEVFAMRSDGMANRKRALEFLMQVKVEGHPDIAKTEGFDCKLDCGKYASDIGKLDNYEWGFNWGQEWYDRRGTALSKP